MNSPPSQPVTLNLGKDALAQSNAFGRDLYYLIIERSFRNAGRFMKNNVAWKVLGMESRNPPVEELLPLIAGTKTRQLFETGDLNSAVVACGQVVAMIHDIVPVSVVIDRMANGARETLKRLSAT